MSAFQQAVAWSGSGATLSLFGIWPNLPSGEPRVSPDAQPRSVKRYVLEDLDSVLPSGEVVEFDLAYDDLPADIENVLRAWLSASLSSGAAVAWFAFEGTFSGEHLLTADVASALYGVADADGVEVAVDDTVRHGRRWRARVENARRRVFTQEGSSSG